jgi:hypothetical protein
MEIYVSTRYLKDRLHKYLVHKNLCYEIKATCFNLISHHKTLFYTTQL